MIFSCEIFLSSWLLCGVMNSIEGYGTEKYVIILIENNLVLSYLSLELFFWLSIFAVFTTPRRMSMKKN